MSDENEFIPAYSGITTFMHTPHHRELANVDIAVVGIPFDSGAASWRSGTRMGPRTIREHSLQIWGYSRHLRIAPTRERAVVDYGDVAVDPISMERTSDMVAAQVGAILKEDVMVMALGGDHSLSYPLLQAHAEKHGPLALIHFDSHTDTYLFHEHLEHGSPFALALRDGYIDKDAYIQVGIRGPMSEPGEIAEAVSQGAKVLTIDDCFEMGIPDVIKAIRSRIGTRKVYVTVDIDAVDPAFAPGTGTPEVGGFSSYQMLQLVRGLEGLDIVGADLVEVNPLYDAGGMTAILAANLTFELLCLLALNR